MTQRLSDVGRRKIAAGVLLVVVVGTAAILVSSGGRSHEFHVGAVADVDRRIPDTVKVAVISDTELRLSFLSAQHVTEGSEPGLTFLPASTVVTVDSRPDGDDCKVADPNARRLVTFQRIWKARNAKTNDVPRPFDDVDVPGLRRTKQTSRNLSAGGHVDIALPTALPKHVCAEVNVSVAEGGKGIWGSAARHGL